VTTLEQAGEGASFLSSPFSPRVVPGRVGEAGLANAPQGDPKRKLPKRPAIVGGEGGKGERGLFGGYATGALSALL